MARPQALAKVRVVRSYQPSNVEDLPCDTMDTELLTNCELNSPRASARVLGWSKGNGKEASCQ